MATRNKAFVTCVHWNTEVWRVWTMQQHICLNH